MKDSARLIVLSEEKSKARRDKLRLWLRGPTQNVLLIQRERLIRESHEAKRHELDKPWAVIIGVLSLRSTSEAQRLKE